MPQTDRSEAVGPEHAAGRRRLPSPLWLPPAASAATAVHGGRGHAVTVFAHRHRATTLIVLLAAALWPHWNYVARRMVDGSDEPWGVVALSTVAVLLWRDRAAFELPPRAALVAGALLATIAAANLLTLTTPVEELLASLDRALAPLGRTGELISLTIALTIRLIPLTLATANEVLDARKARGAGFSLTAFGIPMVIRSVRRAKMMGEALMARGAVD